MIVRVLLAAMTTIAFASAASAFEGKYAASRSGMQQSATITKAPNGTYNVKVDVSRDRCMGDFEGKGTAAGDKLVARTGDKNDTCRIEITRTPTGIAVKEDRCMMWHGAACEFSGPLTKR